jgi:uncharacterized OB-fold protein
VDLSGDAVLYSYTVVHRQFGRFPDDELPYVSAFVNPIEDLGTRLVSRIVDCDPRELEIGMSLQLTFRDVGGRNAPLFTTSKR